MNLLHNLKVKIFLLIGRGKLDIVDNSPKTQIVQTKSILDDTDDNERLQEYGLETYPYADGNTETLTLYINGDRGRGLTIKCHNRELRPKDLNEGEVCLYSKDSDGNSTNRITIRPGDEIEIKTKDNNIVKINSDGIDITDKNNNNITMGNLGIEITDKNNNTLTMSGATIDINGNTKKFVTYTELNNAITLFMTALNSHTHSGVQAGAGNTGNPTPITFDISASESQKARTG